MRGMLFAGSAREGHAGTLLQLQHQRQGLAAGKLSGAGDLWEPTSVLDRRHSPSPSPPTSVPTLSSPLGAATAGVAALAGANAKNVSPLPWRTVLASAGFVPVQASTFAESQAEALLKRMALMGFRVEKRGGALCLYWQRGELVSVSAWRC